MTNPVTPNIGLNKIDRTSPSTTYFDLEKYIDQNADVVDQFAGETKQSLDSLASRLDTEERREVVLQPGLQVVHAERTAPFSLSGIKGRTLVNLAGRQTNRTVNDTKTTTISVGLGTTGSNTEIINVDVTNTDEGYIVFRQVDGRDFVAYAGKYYAIFADVKLNHVTGSGNIKVGGSGAPAVGAATVDKTKMGVWQRVSYGFTLSADTTFSILVGTCYAQEGFAAANFDVKNVSLHEISKDDYDELPFLSEPQKIAKYPYVNSLQSVQNPYVIRYGENLLPPFYEWEDRTGGFGRIKSPYECSIEGLENGGRWYQYFAPALPNVSYTLSGEASDESKLYAFLCDREKQNLDGQRRSGTFTATEETAYIRVLVNTDTGTGKFVFKNPMLVIGTGSQPFKPHEDSMLAFQTELHANPDDGSDPDVLFEREGQYFKLARWKKVELDGSLNWRVAGTSIVAAKVVAVDMFALNVLSIGERGVKYDGKVLTTQDVGEFTACDVVNISPAGTLFISINNVDSGWGDNYRPTQDEIKAYFMGWRMFDGTVGASALYNRTDNAYKAWVRISDWLGRVDNSVPTTQAPNWTPYQLVYRLSAPTVEPVVSEGCLVLNEGKNHVEVGTGIVLREVVKPFYGSNGRTIINSTYQGEENSKAKYMVYRLLSVYKSGLPDTSAWTFYTNAEYTYGRMKAVMEAERSTYDPSVPYSVTYLKLDKSPIQPITGTLAANEKAQVSDLITGVAEALHRVSVVEQKKVEKDAPGWIAPTLLNGWENYGGSFTKAGYYKDSAGIVHLKGLIKFGTAVAGTLLFTLPEGYRPNAVMIFPVSSNNGSQNVLARLDVTSTGSVIFNSGGNSWFSLDGVHFLAER
ncbi:hypothetical protein [Paenibacillus campinasensis]|uniref:Tail fiber protein n=1 Tax=Paenibacillus campinasensis TaxID=66347 RepID=A0A268EY24_9BACL|nr:hypothetical protein [Paenibacillus campinasensis]PAD78019.1 hypothetical protein CHH67_08480 [Paenibacillus campinasensis]